MKETKATFAGEMSQDLKVLPLNLHFCFGYVQKPDNPELFGVSRRLLGVTSSYFTSSRAYI